ncbi:hypothetical protein GCM10010250_08220 [Streptomyces althioticus]|nr:hypothetical protein GCM10010250_08220 [Streptomyces althioticus]GGQ82354.1 hypothetical protein GCM10010267_51490 [Streptomyces griseorubens]GGT36686.1 hypothetical protein GCM10010243_11900 [Streptomyces matensis]
MGTGGQFFQGPALRDAQCADPFAYEAVQRPIFLRHRQHGMPSLQFGPNVECGWSISTGPGTTKGRDMSALT